ncbi:MAG TPA: hypothetical protein VFV55_03480 [Usitatibacteraceae bacterium]|nr:hypothetical protein [Usitatibacteraceae bacterium]
MNGFVALAQDAAGGRRENGEAASFTMNLDHIRLQLDELEHRAEETRDPMEMRRINLECTALERSIVIVEEEFERNIAMLEAVRKRLRRLRARA